MGRGGKRLRGAQCSPRRWRGGSPASAGIDLRALHGSGPRGRIVKADIEQAALAQPHAEEPAEIFEAAEAVQEPERRSLVRTRPGPAAAGLTDAQVLALYEPGSFELVPP